MRLGEFIDTLAAFPEMAPVRIYGVFVTDPRTSAPAEWAVPGDESEQWDSQPERLVCFSSYRGSYREIALNYSGPVRTRWDWNPLTKEGVHVPLGEREVRCGALLQQAREAVGQTFEGYKGGDYVMDESTPLWIARDNGDYSGWIPGRVELRRGDVLQPDVVAIHAMNIRDYA